MKILHLLILIVFIGWTIATMFSDYSAIEMATLCGVSAIMAKLWIMEENSQ